MDLPQDHSEEGPAPESSSSSPNIPQESSSEEEEKNSENCVKLDLLKLLTSVETYFTKRFSKKLSESQYNKFSIIPEDDEDRQKFTLILQEITTEHKISSKLELTQKENRGIACLLGLAICDALGASTEFIPFIKERRDLIAYDFLDVQKQIHERILDARSGKVGIWTDDCSMALCMADSFLLCENKFDPIHMRYMFHMWLNHGLNNGGRKYSIGLGGNISISMTEFAQNRKEYAKEGDKFNNGNGSLMRLAPVPLNYLHNENEAMDFCAKSSQTTHNGDEAKECAKLMGLILVKLINRKEEKDWKEVIDEACQHFAKDVCEVETVKHLALSEQEPEELYYQQVSKYKKKFTKFNPSPSDRNWNWKDNNFTYSLFRTKIQPHYIGSYCMDALAMALHTVWHTNSFEELALMNANMGGDCDSVGAVAGQFGGAIYGIGEYMMHLYSQMEDSSSGRFEVFLKGYKLVKERKEELCE